MGTAASPVSRAPVSKALASRVRGTGILARLLSPAGPQTRYLDVFEDADGVGSHDGC